MKKVFITGGSGTVGSSFIKKYYKEFKFYSFARNEKMQVALKRRFPDIEIILGSIENKSFLIDTIKNINPDIVLHTAALKHVLTAENQPQQAVEVNIIGSLNIIEASKIAGVPATIAISTDKACEPHCNYGYTKLLMEKMFLTANTSATKFSCCRFGNVAGSYGSVIPHWLTTKNEGPLKLTDPAMNRLMFSPEESAELIYEGIRKMNDKGGFVISKKMKTVNIYKLATLISDNIEIVGAGPGEKLNETMVCEGELPYTKVCGDYIFITQEKNKDLNSRLTRHISSSNAPNMSDDEVKDLIDNVEKDLIANSLIKKEYL